mmetsp:Transcript_70189/g.198989  ORF Transcript_70189/g.198989 Transcript_70189/m.198989 type:complete len:100 (+) Transcript_70189:362-661(+)
MLNPSIKLTDDVGVISPAVDRPDTADDGLERGDGTDEKPSFSTSGADARSELDSSSIVLRTMLPAVMLQGRCALGEQDEDADDPAREDTGLSGPLTSLW